MEETETELLALRRVKLTALEKLGVAPFGMAFETSGDIAHAREKFAEGAVFRIAGRITAHRDMGKSHFVDLKDASGRMQIYLHGKELGAEAMRIFELLDLGDFIGVEGACFTTKTGEPTLKVQKLEVLAKSLRPLPEKWHGLQDVEARYRQRYLDLITNDQSRAIFTKRFVIVREIRRFLEERGFVEVETPMLQAVAGGAAAEPFATHHKALGLDLYLRIAPELYLKRLLVGGFNKVYELNRNFRNEGISRKHNPEFTMLEAYWAYADFEKIAELVEELICRAAGAVLAIEGGAPATPHPREAGLQSSPLQIQHRDAEGNVRRTIDLTRPWRRARYHDLVRDAAGADWFEVSREQRRDRAKELGVEILPQLADFEVTQHVFEKLVEEKTFDPLFVTHCPKELVPLAKQNRDNRELVDVYELIINGAEISPGYTELNDPNTQRQRLLEQAGEETQKLDEDFLLALEHGMPPAGGFGLGIDRLTMLLTGAESIRDVILFPLLRPKRLTLFSNMPTLPATSSLLREKPRATGQYALLRGVPLFAALDDAAVDELCGYLHPVELKAGSSLFRVGDAGDAMYIIESGRVRITVTDADGREVILASLGHGDFFGEMAMLDGHGRSADAAVTEDSRLAMLTRENFLNFVSSDSRIILEMLSAITRRLRRTDDLLRHRVSRNANEEDARQLTLADRCADKIARFGGSWKFITMSLVMLMLWMVANTMLLRERSFDPFPFVLLNLVLGMIAALQAPIIMMSQNREAQKDRLRADLDYQVNLKNEMLLAEILRLLEKRQKDARRSHRNAEE